MVRTVVQAGDTLWELAAAAYEAAGIPSESVDLRPVIYEIRKRNRMTSAQIVPGQVVLIPVRR
ncbi:MAG: LysM peptidoglycan-binding domain-containing protein [Firmicutes bacterium]|nr:LysM peptidoglycan-binding domain-containing protein [Bacillota bacterium]